MTPGDIVRHRRTGALGRVIMTHREPRRVLVRPLDGTAERWYGWGELQLIRGEALRQLQREVPELARDCLAGLRQAMKEDEERHPAPRSGLPTLEEQERRAPDWSRVEHERRIDRERRKPKEER